jgi:phenylalanyl-tRNA synthetase alpha chain
MTQSTQSAPNDLADLEAHILSDIAGAGDEDALEAMRVATLGKSGTVTLRLRELGKMTPDERQVAGPALNVLRDKLNAAIAARKDILENAALEERLKTESLDMSLMPPRTITGTLHPVSQVMEEMTAIFADMGFAVAEGPDIEDDFHNFTALNFPEKHPARDMHDTFFFEPGPDGTRKLLRTHTSPVQIRTMISQKPPIRIIAPGRTYRCDSDQTHTPMFHQIEGLVIDTETHMGHLKGVLMRALASFFEVDGVEVRFRPHHFPFTEPSAEMDVRCDRSGGQLKIGTGKDWLEILGCGMVHPNVLRACGLDPEVYQGFAFGMGIDRLAMLKYAIPDLRDMFAADARWTRHYGFSPFMVPTLAAGLS